MNVWRSEELETCKLEIWRFGDVMEQKSGDLIVKGSVELETWCRSASENFDVMATLLESGGDVHR